MSFLNSCPAELASILKVVNTIILYIRIFIPILLIIFGSIDLGKAVMAGEEKEIKAATSLLLKKVIAAAVVFLLVTIITLVLNVVNVDDNVTWKDCINESKK